MRAVYQADNEEVFETAVEALLTDAICEDDNGIFIERYQRIKLVKFLESRFVITPMVIVRDSCMANDIEEDGDPF